MKLPRFAAGLLLALAAGLLPGLGGPQAQQVDAGDDAELAPLWTALRRQSAVYRRAVLRFTCVEDLIETMGAQGLKLHRSDTTSLTAGPEGILAANDVIVKILAWHPSVV